MAETRRLHSVDAPSIVLSLERSRRGARLAIPERSFATGSGVTLLNLHRFDEVINGREYHIEVSAVGLNKWRAQVARTPGGSTATMPFYGTTPDEAAAQLSRWLSLAHGQPRSQL